MRNLSSCPVCLGSSLQYVGQHQDRRKCLSGEWSFASCKSCDSVFLNPMPEESDLIRFYDSYYEGDSVGVAEFNNRSGVSKWLRKLFHVVTGDVDPRDMISISSDDIVLDYGCGPGVYMHEFLQESENVYGADLSQDAVSVGVDLGLKIELIENIDKIPFENNKFSHIYAFQVLEHLTNPHSFMGELGRVSKDGAEVFLAFPNVDSVWRRIFKTNWLSGWFCPFHVVLYNEKSVRELAESHNFTVKNISSRTPVSWFMLNLRACFVRSGSVERSKIFLDKNIFKYTLMLILRCIEIFPFQRDCLIVKLVKK